MRAGEAAAAAGVTIKALRYYEECGLLSPGRAANGYRDYTVEDVRLAEEIHSLGALGLTPKETGPFLACLRAGHDAGDHCAESLAAYQQKIDALDLLVTRLTHTREQLISRRDAAARRGFPSAADPSKELDEMLPKADPLPPDLPVPVDDGASAHLPGRTLPALSFHGTDGGDIRLDTVSDGRWVLFLYPLTGDPAADIPEGWNEIPGARGCSQEACSFRDNLDALRAEGVDRVLALSSDRADYQQALVDRLHLPYPMLSDPHLQLADELKLPTFEANGQTLYRRLTLVLRGATIEHVFYPVFPPDTHADQVAQWFRNHHDA
ncbi:MULTISPECIES: MerR family transcriptional regulator [Streptomyces]|uniref:Alkyl hydroperoxide reductase subunit C protein n=1 Tax=Streptomyces venezuelae (strain ATCC 10712 / CBS 650.69 / DSM 40230 / JCM 4526 / NBRC 13096 / PD 04745) TaxID=953739 RepID=F2RGB8_STRVP|nr:MerR family transcriptional regulator [Streptomyces venezuelae]APE25256.1 peroxiredoxin [Streptomyces venezuelae]QES02597.1 MerR family transcriptional regulator [Streptomyces venezuelae ATCC 10712]CCA59838.1 Alkyl hydroperoxide reductase subunit C protein [Streptomyces venezuelae ATCC 10712]